MVGDRQKIRRPGSMVEGEVCSELKLGQVLNLGTEGFGVLREPDEAGRSGTIGVCNR